MPGESAVVSGLTSDALVPVQIGEVFQYFSTLKVAAISFRDGCDQVIRLGNQLRFGPCPDSTRARTRRIVVRSMERWHKPLQEASGPEPVAILTGFHVRRGTPVFLLVKPV
ncbi:MAG: hypothetical protein PHH01_03020 [Patescibacteria group bacterium]|nr:hypothetical protein [Patescibacteria group bacterium]